MVPSCLRRSSSVHWTCCRKVRAAPVTLQRGLMIRYLYGRRSHANTPTAATRAPKVDVIKGTAL